MKPGYFKEALRQKSILCFMVLTTLISGNQLPAKAFTDDVEWTLLSQKDGIEVSYLLEGCNSGQRILFKIQNKTSSKHTVDFKCKITAGGNDIIISSLKNTVEANSTLKGSCTDKPFQSTFIAIPKDVSVEGIVITIK
jgi:hypothetical protein